jgi:Ca2+-binding EF-hand superfamily protein
LLPSRLDNSLLPVLVDGHVKALTFLMIALNEQEIKKMLNKIDRDGRRIIGYPAFLEMMKEKFGERGTMEEIMKAFQLFDHDGTVSFHGLMFSGAVACAWSLNVLAWKQLV